MLWEVEILPKDRDPERERVAGELRLLLGAEQSPLTQTSRGYLFEGVLNQSQAESLLQQLLLDPLVEQGRVGRVNERAFSQVKADARVAATVLLKPGVMDPVAESVQRAGEDLGVPLASVRTFRRYYAPQA